MEDLLSKLQYATGRSFGAFPVSVIEYFNLNKKEFNFGNFEITVSFFW